MAVKLVPIAALLALTACGGRQALEPPPGQALPVAAATSPVTPTTDEMLERRPIEKPARVDELLRRSEPREDDRFDLPPQ